MSDFSHGGPNPPNNCTKEQGANPALLAASPSQSNRPVRSLMTHGTPKGVSDFGGGNKNHPEELPKPCLAATTIPSQDLKCSIVLHFSMLHDQLS
jgi:hypothetical protein